LHLPEGSFSFYKKEKQYSTSGNFYKYIKNIFKYEENFLEDVLSDSIYYLKKWKIN